MPPVFREHMLIQSFFKNTDWRIYCCCWSLHLLLTWKV